MQNSSFAFQVFEQPESSNLLSKNAIASNIHIMPSHSKLGDWLLQQGVISATQHQHALQQQIDSGQKFGTILIEQGHISEETLLQALAQQLELPLIDLTTYRYHPDTVRLIAENHARRWRAIALEQYPDGLLVGMADPSDIVAVDSLVKLLKMPLQLAVVREADLLHTLDAVYRRTHEINSFAGELQEEIADRRVDLAQIATPDNAQDAPVARLLHSLFEDAIQVHASDIHIEPDEQVLRIRQRIDNVLHEQIMNETSIAPALVLRLKLMAGLDIAEKRLPQDGRFTLSIRNKRIDVRLSTLPVQHGESVVMRLLDQSQGHLDFTQLGMPTGLHQRVEQILQQPHGMLLVTGPTGSGKTTTLYAALNRLNSADRKIISVEDPVEYRLSRVNQVQVNTEIGLSFARVLRAALRQDPDVVLVGEMRDEETVEIGLRAAMTGHLVLSTLHTNDAVSCAGRLLDMGAKGYLVASALQAVLAQRLVRRLCPSCIETYALTASEQSWLAKQMQHSEPVTKLQRSLGCAHCHHTGYRGRIGVFELLDITPKLGELLIQGDTAAFARQARQQAHYQSLCEAALQLALQGVTSLVEVERLCRGMEDG